MLTAIETNPLALQNLSAHQLWALDADRNGYRDLRDVSLLERASFDFVHLVSDFVLIPITANSNECRTTITITLGSTSRYLTQNSTYIYFGVFNVEATFQQVFNRIDLVNGTRLPGGVGLPRASFGGWWKAEYAGNGIFSVATGPLEDRALGIGLVVLQVSESGIGVVADSVAFLTGSFSDTPEFGPMSANFLSFSTPVQVNHTTGFDPWYQFDIPYASRECVNMYAPEWVITGPYTQILGETDDLSDTILVEVSATDADTGAAGIVNYFLYNSTRPGLFSINASTGHIIVQQPLDYETFTTVNLTILAIDQGPHMFSRRTASVLYYIELLDRNDNPPLPESLHYNVTVSEGYVGPTDLFIRVEDGDVFSAEYRRTSFNILSGDPNDQFQLLWLNDSAARLHVVRAIDRELITEFNLTASASNTEVTDPPGPQATVFSIFVQVMDINDNPPMFPPGRIYIPVSESVMVNDVLYRVSATDLDLGEAAEITYDIDYAFEANHEGTTLSSDNLKDEYFSINSSTGQLTLLRKFDREGSITTLLTQFLALQPPHTSSQLAIIQVCEENDNAPVFMDQPYSATLSELDGANTFVTRVSASDRDLGPFCRNDTEDEDGNNDVRFELFHTDSGPFVINATSGEIHTSGPLDHETRSSYNLTVVAKDRGVPTQSTFAYVTVTISDVNDEKPAFDLAALTVSISEDAFQMGDDLVTMLTITDTDPGSGGIIDVAITGGNEDGKFSLQSQTNEVVSISLLSPLNWEEVQQYQLNITATDRGTPQLSSTALLVVNVLDVNDNRPVFFGEPYTTTISENSALGSHVITVTAYDADKEDNETLRYFLTDNASGQFSIDPVSGEIIVQQSLCISSVERRYTLQVRVSDRPGSADSMDSTETASVTVQDENVYDPEFIRTQFVTVVPPDTPPSTEVIVLDGTDRDLCSNAQPFQYDIVPGSGSGNFTVNASSVLTSSSWSPPGTLGNTFPVTVRISDRGSSSPPRINTADLYVVTGSLPAVEFTSTLGLPLSQTVSSAVGGTFTQRHGMFQYASSSPPSLTATFGGLSVTRNFSASPQPLVDIQATLLSPTLFADSEYVYVAVMGLNMWQGTLISETEVNGRVSLNGEVSSASVNLSSDTPMAVLPIPIPTSWRETSTIGMELRNLAVTVQAASRTIMYEAVLYTSPSAAALFSDPEFANASILVSLPKRNLFSNQQAYLTVYTKLEPNPVTSFVVTCESNSPDIVFMSRSSASNDSWSSIIRGEGSAVQLAATKAPGTPASVAQVLVPFTVAQNVMPTSADLTCWGTLLIRSAPYFISEEPFTVSVTSRGASQLGNGTVFFTVRELRDVFLRTDFRSLLNTAVLNGQRVTKPIVPRGVWLDAVPSIGGIPEDSLFCASSNGSVFKVSDSCSVVYLTGEEVSGADEAFLNVTVMNQGTFAIPIAVWYPDLPLTVSPQDSILNAIVRFEVNGTTACQPGYQWSKLSVTANYRTSPGSTEILVVVDSLVEGLLESSNDNAVMVSDLTIRGLASASTVRLSVRSPMKGIIGAVEVSVDAQTVVPRGLLTYVASDLLLNPADTAVHPGSEFTVELDPSLSYIGQVAELITFVVFSDGHAVQLTEDAGLVYVSTSESVSVTGNQATVWGQFEGYPLTAQWWSACGGSVYQDPVRMDTTFMSPTLRVELNRYTLVPLSDTSLSYDIDVSSSASIRIFLTLGSNGDEHDVTTNSNTNITVSHPDVVSLVQESDYYRLVAVSSAIPTEVTVSVFFQDLAADVTVQVVTSSNMLTLSVKPYPSYSSAPDLETLEYVGITGIYQFAQLQAEWVFSYANGSTSSVSVIDSSSIRLESSNVTVADVNLQSGSSEARTAFVSAYDVGDVVFTATLGPLNSSASLTVSNMSLSISSATIQIGTPTLAGTYGITGAQIVLDFALSNGVIVSNYYNGETSLYPGLVALSSSAENAAEFDELTGEVTILRNLAGATFINAVFADGAQTSAQSQPFTVNLEPRVGELDLGAVTGVPIASVNVGDVFDLPVRLNAENQSLGAWEVALAYDSDLLELVSVTGRRGSTFRHSRTAFEGAVLIGGIEDSPFIATSATELAVVQFRAKASTSGSPAGIEGEVSALADGEGNRLPYLADSRAAEVGVIIGTSGSTSAEITVLPTTNLQVFSPTRTPCNSPLCSCGATAELGDVNGDCVFNILDAAESCDTTSVDFNLDGSCDEQDFNYLLEVAFYQAPFVSDLSISPVTPSSCYLYLNVQLELRGRRDADNTSVTNVLFLLMHRDPVFTEQFDLSVARNTLGRKVAVSGIVPPSVSIGALLGSHIGAGVYAVQLRSALSLQDVGVSLVVLANDGREWLFGSDVPPAYPERAELSIVFSMLPALVRTFPVGFSPLTTFPAVITSDECVNNVAPVFYPPQLEVSVVEETQGQSFLVRVFANDSDPGSGGQVRYSFEYEAAYSLFSVDETSGEVTVLQPLDREGPLGDIIELGIVATDMGNFSTRSATITVQVTILDINDNAPQFAQTAYEVERAEGGNVGTQVLNLFVFDPDAGNNGNVTYELFGNPFITDYFTVASGIVFLAKPLDYETIKQLDFMVIARDQGTPVMSSSASVSVTVLPINEYPPVCDPERYSAVVHRPVLLGDKIITVAISDADSTPQHRDMSFVMNSTVFDLVKEGPNVFSLTTSTTSYSVTEATVHVRAQSTSDTDQSCLVRVDVQFVDTIPYDIHISGPGFLLSQQERLLANGSFAGASQDLLFLGDVSQPVQIATTVGGLTQSATFTKPLQPVASIVGVVQRENYWVDQRVVTAALQLRDASLSTVAVSGSDVTLQLVPLTATQSEVTSEAVQGGDCTPHSLSGICWTSVEIPGMWFQAGGYSQVRVYAISSQIRMLLHEVTLNTDVPVVFDGEDRNIVVSLPNSVVVQNDEFPIILQTVSPIVVDAFQITLSSSSSEILLQEPVDTGEWMCQQQLQNAAGASTLKLACLLQSMYTPKSHGVPQDLFTFTARAVAATGGSYRVSADVDMLSTTRGPLVVGQSIPAVFKDRSGLQTGGNGSVSITTNELQGIFAYTNTSELVNTARINWQNVSAGVAVYGIFQSMGNRMSPLTSSLTCTNQNSVLGIAADCSSVFLTHLHMSSAERSDLQIRYGGRSFSLPFRVWQPITESFRVSVSDDNLQPISGWFSDSDCTSSYYQSARVYATGRFNAGTTLESPTLDLTDFLRPMFELSNPSAVNLIGGYVVARTPGSSSSVALNLFERSQSMNVFVTSTRVDVSATSARVVTDIDLQGYPTTVSTTSIGLSVNLGLTQSFSDSSTVGYAIATVYYSDGRGMHVSATASPEHPGVSISSGISLLSNVTGHAVNAVYSPTCVTSSPASALAFVTSSYPAAAGLLLTLSSTVVAHASHGIPQDAVPTSVVMQAWLTLEDGSRLDVTNRAMFHSAAGLLQFTGSTASPTSHLDIGVDVVSALYEYNQETYAAHVSLTVADPVRMEVQLRPYPFYEGGENHSLTTIRPISGTTDLYQDVVVVMRIELSGGEVVSAFPDSNTNVTLSDNTPVVILYDLPNMILLRPRLEGVTTVDVRLGGGLNASVQLTVFSFFNDTADIVSIDLELVSLSSASSTQFAIIGCLNLDDGTKYCQTEGVANNSGLARTLDFSVNPAGVASVTGTVVTVLRNYPNPLSLRAVAKYSSTVSTAVEFAANLITDANVGGVDMGQRTGIAIASVNVGEAFTVDLRVNIGSNTVQAVEALILYNSSLLAVNDVTVALPGVFAVRTNSPPGEVAVSGLGRQVASSGILTIATISLTALASGTASIRAELPVLLDSGMASLTTNESTQVNYVYIAGQEMQNAGSENVPSRQALPANSSGDYNGDGVFDVVDPLQLWLDVFAPTPGARDPNKDGVLDAQDVQFALRARSGLVPFLDSYSIYPVGVGSNCNLTISVTLQSGTQSGVILTELTHVFVVISHSSIAEFLEQSQFAEGRSVAVLGGSTFILEAAPVRDSVYEVSIYTPIQTSDIQLESIIAATTEIDGMTHYSRYALFTSALPPAVTTFGSFASYRMPALVADSYAIAVSPLGFFSNDRRSDVCAFVAVPLNVTVLEEQRPQFVAVISLGDPSFPSLTGAVSFVVDQPSFYLTGAGTTRTLYALRLNREDDPQFVVNVTASQGGVAIGTKVVNVQVGDVNDNQPMFVNPPELVSNVSESTLPSTVIVSNLTTTDADVGINAEVTYSFADGNIGNSFGINSTSGAIYINKFLDFEARNSYDLVVQATDQGIPPQSSTTIIRVVVTDVDEALPTFVQDFYNVTIKEADYSSNNMFLLTLNATDPDSGPAGLLTYRLVNSSSLFRVDGTTGDLFVIGDLDRETQSVVTFQVAVEDQSVNPGRDSAVVVVYVEDANDNEPIFVDLETNLYVEEDLPVGTVITTVSASDEDNGSNALVAYSFQDTSGQVQDAFEIDRWSGELTLRESVLGRVGDHLTLTYLAQDQGQPQNSQTAIAIVLFVEKKFVRFFADRGALLLGSPQRTGQLSYTHEIGFPFLAPTGGDISISSQVHVVEPSVDIEEPPLRPFLNIPTIGDAASSVQASPIQQRVYHDWRSLYVLLKAFDNRGLPFVRPAMLNITLQPSPQLDINQTPMTASCTTDAATGSCVASFLSLPGAWFEKSATTNDHVTVFTSSGDFSIDVETSPAHSTVYTKKDVVVQGPTRPIYRSSYFNVLFYMDQSVAFTSGDYSTEIRLDVGISPTSVASGEGWTCGEWFGVQRLLFICMCTCCVLVYTIVCTAKFCALTVHMNHSVVHRSVLNRSVAWLNEFCPAP